MYSFGLSVTVLLSIVTIGFVKNLTGFQREACSKSYFYETGTIHDFQRAKEFCESQNSTLVQIRSHDEHQ